MNPQPIEGQQEAGLTKLHAPHSMSCLQCTYWIYFESIEFLNLKMNLNRSKNTKNYIELHGIVTKKGLNTLTEGA